MNLQKLQEQLKIDEGVKYELYHDHLGYLTGGIGHLVKPEEPEYAQTAGTKLTEARVTEWFENDVKLSIGECEALYGKGTFDSFPGEVQEILVNMIFNLGRTRLSKFKNFRSALEAKDWKRAAKEGRDSLWCRQVKNRAERLMTRLEKVEGA